MDTLQHTQTLQKSNISNSSSSFMHLADTKDPLAPISEEQLINDLETSEGQIADGLGMDATAAIMEIGRAHGYI